MLSLGSSMSLGSLFSWQSLGSAPSAQSTASVLSSQSTPAMRSSCDERLPARRLPAFDASALLVSGAGYALARRLGA